MQNKSEEILKHVNDFMGPAYALRIIESVRFNNNVAPEHFFIGIGYSDDPTGPSCKTQDYYEIVDGELYRKYYHDHNSRFDYIRTPQNLDEIINSKHLVFFSYKELVDVVAQHQTNS